MPAEPVAEAGDQAAAEGLAEKLGEGYEVHPVPVVDPDRIRIVQTWMCRAKLVDGFTPDIQPPQRLEGAAVIVPSDGRPPWDERVVRDTDAERLDALLGGPRVRHFTAYAYTPERAREMARNEADRLSGE